MSKDLKDNKYCNCQIYSDKNIIKPNKNYSFCEKCGSILIKDGNNNICYTIKPKQKQKPIEFNPIEIIKSMKKKTDLDYPNLNNEYNIGEGDKYNKENIIKSINLYLKHRKMIILTLQKMMKMLDFSDLIFFQTLFYIDNYLSHNMTEDFSEKKILYYLVGYFLCSAKLKETDIYEPSLDSFCCLKKKIYLTVEKIAYYEVICLQSIKYNVFSYSAYDWICELNTVGYVFNCEINKNNSIILINGHRHSILNTISKYALKTLLNVTIKDIFIKYSPMYIAFSLIQIAREKYIDKKNIYPKLYYNLISLYGVNHKDYRNCYKELKNEIEEKQIESNEILDTEKKINKDILDNELLKKISNDDTSATSNYCKMDKNVVVSNKLKSSNVIPSIPFLKENLIKMDEKKEEIKNGKNDNNENKNDNIDNNNDELILNLNDDEPKSISDENKVKSSNELNHILPKNKNKLFIDCNNNAYKSNSNLPKINLLFESSIKQTDITNDKTNAQNLKYSSSKQVVINNKFLKTNQKTLNPIKKKNTMIVSDNKRYFQSNFSNNKASGFKPKEDLDSMRKSLFCGNTNNNNKRNSKEAIVILGNTRNKMKSSSMMPQIQNLENLVQEDIKDIRDIEEEIKNNYNDINNDNKKREKCKSKEKSKNNLVGKETKTIVSNRRNQSTNNRKKKL